MEKENEKEKEREKEKEKLTLELTSSVWGNCSNSRLGRLVKLIFSAKCFLMSWNFFPLVPQRAILSPRRPRSLKSKCTRATTPRDLSLLLPAAPVHPVTYSPGQTQGKGEGVGEGEGEGERRGKGRGVGRGIKLITCSKDESIHFGGGCQSLSEYGDRVSDSHLDMWD